MNIDLIINLLQIQAKVFCLGFFCVFTALLLPIFRGSPPGDGGGIVKNR